LLGCDASYFVLPKVQKPLPPQQAKSGLPPHHAKIGRDGGPGLAGDPGSPAPAGNGPLPNHEPRKSSQLAIWPVLPLAVLLAFSLLQLTGEPQRSRAFAALAVTLAFAAGARRLRAVSLGGAAAGAVVSFVIYTAGGAGAFGVLLAVFLLTWLATRLGYSRKQKLGIAESRSGRTASQVTANLVVAAAALAVSTATHEVIFSLAGVAALAEAAADTISSEVGQVAAPRAFLIHSFQPVAAGTDGAISLPGTLAGIAGALLVASAAGVFHVIEPRLLWPAAAAGVLGMVADSFLGATLETRRMLSNDGVNLLSTVIAAVTAGLLTLLN